ncbi:MAG: hypothetical protein JNJ88_21140 [Planctomycetes bacterium]|nr:hypothetical protein [Planctomycetota bacterium]
MLTIHSALTRARLRREARSGAFEAGQQLVSERRVAVERWTSEEVVGRVVGQTTALAQVSFITRRTKLRYECSLHESRSGQACSHAIAVALKWLQILKARRLAQHPECPQVEALAEPVSLMREDSFTALQRAAIDGLPTEEALRGLREDLAATDRGLRQSKGVREFQQILDGLLRRVVSKLPPIALAVPSPVALEALRETVSFLDRYARGTESFAWGIMRGALASSVQDLEADLPEPCDIAINAVFLQSQSRGFVDLWDLASSREQEFGTRIWAQLREQSATRCRNLVSVGAERLPADLAARDVLEQFLERIAETDAHREQLYDVMVRDAFAVVRMQKIAQTCRRLGFSERADHWNRRAQECALGVAVNMAPARAAAGERRGAPWRVDLTRFQHRPSFDLFVRLRDAMRSEPLWPKAREECLERLRVGGRIEDHLRALLSERRFEEAAERAMGHACDPLLALEIAADLAEPLPERAFELWKLYIPSAAALGTADSAHAAAIHFRRFAHLAARLSRELEAEIVEALVRERLANRTQVLRDRSTGGSEVSASGLP